MANQKGPNIKKKAICKNCEGKGLLKKGNMVVKCLRCHGTKKQKTTQKATPLARGAAGGAPRESRKTC